LALGTTTTNNSGAYTFTGLPSGSYGITPSNPGYTFTPANRNVSLGTTNVTGVNFMANGTTVAPAITTQPGNQTVTAGQAATFTFDNVTTGTSSASQSVTITNTGNSSVTISQIAVSGAGYSMTGGGAPVTLAPSQSLTLNVQFSPTATGSVNGTISITSNASDSPPSVSLSATGVEPVQHSAVSTWNASTSTVVGYKVYRSTVTGSSYTKINSSLVSALTYTDSTVQSGTTYLRDNGSEFQRCGEGELE
jgi:Abnormal spindle-like microcephaly-assoc'd, ASPM-SPD-2-Hydin